MHPFVAASRFRAFRRRPSNASHAASVSAAAILLATLAHPASAVAQQVVPSSEACEVAGLSAHHYGFDESGTLADGSGERPLSAASTELADGVIGPALAFPSSEAVSLGAGALSSGSGLTVALWVRPDDLDSVEARFLSQASGLTSAEHVVMLGAFRGSALRFRLKVDGVTRTLKSRTGRLRPDTWTHVAATFGDGSMRIWQDGEIVATTRSSGTVTVAPGIAVALGNQPAGAGERPFRGRIDEVRIHDEALDASGIAALMAYRPETCGDPSGPVDPPDTDAPPTPPSFEAFRVTPTSATVTWESVEDVGTAGLAGYRLLRGGAPLGDLLTSTSFTDQGLMPGSDYSYTLTAVDTVGNTSVPISLVVSTEEEPVAIVPGPPTEPAASIASTDAAGRSTVSFEWRASSDDPDVTYEVFRDGESIGRVYGATSLLDEDLPPATTFGYAVRTIGSSGLVSASTDPVFVTSPDPEPEPDPPAVPIDLVATLETGVDDTRHDVSLTWTGNVDGGTTEVVYELRRDGVSRASGLETPVYLDTGLAAESSFAYSVRSVADDGRVSDWSDAVTIDTPDAPVGGEPEHASCAVLAGATHRYPFDGGVGAGLTDDAVGARDAVASGVLAASGVSGDAVSLDASSTISLGAFEPGARGALTISGWVRPTSLDSVEARFVSKANGTSSDGHYVMAGAFRGSALRFRLKIDGTTHTLISGTGQLAPGVWTHVAFVYDGVTMSIRRDGRRVAARRVVGGITAGPGVPVAIGNQPVGAGDRPFLGDLDEFAFFDEALDGEALARLAEPGAEPCEAPPSTGGGDDDRAPPAPGGVDVRVPSATRVELSWSPVEDEGPAGLAGYRVYRDGTPIASTELPSFADDDVIGDRTYVYGISAFDAASPPNESARTIVVADTPVASDEGAPPGVDTFDAVDITSTSVRLVWTAPTDDAGEPVEISGYDLSRDGRPLASIESNGVEDDGLTPSTRYVYALVAIGPAPGLARSVAVELEVTTADPDPADLPPVVAILSPGAGATFANGDVATFSASAEDPTDGDVGGTMVWRSDKDGLLGSGASIGAVLSTEGTHRVTATATDSDGRSATAEVLVVVVGQVPIVPVTPLTLFDGESLDGFHTWLNDTGFSDPDGIFTADENGLRLLPNELSGGGRSQGSLITDRSYADYVAVLEFRWGDVSLTDRVKDAGLMFHSQGEYGGWLDRLVPGFQAQIVEGGMGDIMLLEGPVIPMSMTADVVQLPCVFDTWNCRGGFVWDEQGAETRFEDDVSDGPRFGHVHTSVWDPAWQNVAGFRGETDYESEDGDWNQLVVVADGDTVDVHFNGQRVNSARNVFPQSGRLQLQIERSEYLVRRLDLLPLGSAVGPMIVDAAAPDGTVAAPYAYRFSAVGMDAPVRWELGGGLLPEGLTLDEVSGEVGGVPTVAGTFEFALRVVDALGEASERVFSMVVEEE